MPFSWAKTIKDAEKIKLRRAIQMAKKGLPDFKTAHPDEVRDANQKNYAKLTTRIKDECKKYQEMVIGRRNKIAGK